VQKSSIGDVVKYVEEVVAIAEQTATGTQQVAGTAKQLSSSMQELTMSSQELNEIAEDLQSGISQFKLINGEKLFQRQRDRRFGAVPHRLKLQQSGHSEIIDLPVRPGQRRPSGKSNN
jgi:hypothetical protein